MENLSRRNIIRAAAGFAGGAAVSAAAVLPAAKAATGDPLPALLARRQAILRHLNNTSDPDHSPFWNELTAIEGSLEAAVPTTREGVIAQLQYLLDFSEEGWDFDGRLWKMVQNVVAGIKRMPGGAA